MSILITRRMALQYEILRQSGITNMFGARPYLGWDRDEFGYMLKHYSELMERWPEIRAEAVEPAKQLREGEEA